MPRSHRVRRLVAVACAGALVAGLAACAPEASAQLEVPPQVEAALPDDTQAQLTDAVERAVAASGSSGALAGVWVPWAGTWLAGVGTASPEGRAITESASFKAGAVTRAMTCDVLYGLVDDGRVKLGDSVAAYVPGLPDKEGVTLESLCDSTSGIASYGDSVSSRLLQNPARVWNPRELVAYGLGKGGDAPVGSVFADSDTGYVLLGLALERAAGVPAAQLLEKYVFTPAGMDATSLPSIGGADLHGLWAPTAEDGTVACTAPIDVTDLSPSAGYTASGVVSDLADLGRYTRALATGARPYDAKGRFDDALPAAADAPSWFTAAGGAYQAGTLIGQYGSMPGYLTAAFADENTGMTVVVVLNDSRASATLVRSLAWQLASIASKTPPASGQTAPDAGLPWTAEDMATQVDAAAVCPLP